MTKQDLQKELKEKVRVGVKPSDIKKLKRSKSAGDIPLAPPLPTSTPVSRSKSTEPFSDPKYPYTTLISQQQELEDLRKETESKSTTISLLRKKIGELESSVSSLEKGRQELEKETKEKSTHNDALLEKLAEVYEELNNFKENAPSDSAELDNSLLARHQNLKDWFKQYQKSQQLDKELSQNIDEASNELTDQDEKISQLRTEIRQLKQTNQSLTKDLELAERAVEWRSTPFLPHSENDWTYLKYALYSLMAGLFVWWLVNSFKNK